MALGKVTIARIFLSREIKEVSAWKLDWNPVKKGHPKWRSWHEQQKNFTARLWLTSCRHETKCLISNQISNRSQYRTMLQKLSKCEVEDWLCRNLTILLPLRFYVKSNFGLFKQFKNVIFSNFRGFEFWFSKFEQLSSPEFTKIQSSHSLKLPKNSFLDRLSSSKLDFS